MGSLIVKIKNVTIEGGEKLYRDPSINSGTRTLFDMSNSWSGGGKNVLANSVIKSRSYENSEGTFNKAHTYSGGGMVWPKTSNDKFILPTQIVPSVNDKHWMITTWLKITNAGQSGFNNQVLSIGGIYSNTNAFLRIVPTNDANGVPTNIEVRVLGKNYVVFNQLLPLFNGQVHQFGVELIKSDDGLQQRVIFWIDKVSVYDSGFAAVATTPPSDSSERYIGTSASLPTSWGGSFYRVRFDDLDFSKKTALSVLTKDFSFSNSRYS